MLGYKVAAGGAMIEEGTARKNEQTALMEEERENKYEEDEALNRL